MNIVSLFDMSGIMVHDWAEAGCECHCFDEIALERSEIIGSGRIHFHQVKFPSDKVFTQIASLKPAVIFSFAPCTDLAGSGAKHFETKFEKDPMYRAKALELIVIAESLAEYLNCEWLQENPVGMLSTIWRAPDFYFDPCDYGGYLPVNDVHPMFPEYIESRDGYTKKTCIWKSKGLLKPPTKPVLFKMIEDQHGNRFSKQTAMLGGKSMKTKIIRSLTPRGFARAMFETNYPLLKEKNS